MAGGGTLFTVSLPTLPSMPNLGEKGKPSEEMGSPKGRAIFTSL